MAYIYLHPYNDDSYVRSIDCLDGDLNNDSSKAYIDDAVWEEIADCGRDVPYDWTNFWIANINGSTRYLLNGSTYPAGTHFYPELINDNPDSGGGSDGGYDTTTVKRAQAFVGTDIDGIWGSNSTNAARSRGFNSLAEVVEVINSAMPLLISTYYAGDGTSSQLPRAKWYNANGIYNYNADVGVSYGLFNFETFGLTKSGYHPLTDEEWSCSGNGGITDTISDDGPWTCPQLISHLNLSPIYKGTLSDGTLICKTNHYYFDAYPQWEANTKTYTISYNPNGGDSTPANQIKNYGTSITLSPAITNSVTITYNLQGGSMSSATSQNLSKTFLYWFEKAVDNQADRTYAGEASYSREKSIELKATWGDRKSIILPTPTKTDYTFKGWSTNPEATEGITGRYTTEENQTLYAIWEYNLKLNKIYYWLNDGMTDTPWYIDEFYYDSSIQYPEYTLISTIPQRDGFIFIGWDYPSNGETWYPGDIIQLFGDNNFYALWEPIPTSYTIYFEDPYGPGTYTQIDCPIGESIIIPPVKGEISYLEEQYYSITLMVNNSTYEVMHCLEYVIEEPHSWTTGNGDFYLEGDSYTPTEDTYFLIHRIQKSGQTSINLPILNDSNFIGWNENQNASTGITGEYFNNKDTILYAIFSQDNTYIKINGSWQKAILYVKTNGNWKKGTPSIQLSKKWI